MSYAMDCDVYIQEIDGRLSEYVQNLTLENIGVILTFMEYFYLDTNDVSSVSTLSIQYTSKCCSSSVPVTKLHVSADAMQRLFSCLLQSIRKGFFEIDKQFHDNTGNTFSRLLRILEIVISRNTSLKEVMLRDPPFLLNFLVYLRLNKVLKYVCSLLYKAYFGTTVISQDVSELQYKMALEIVNNLNNCAGISSSKNSNHILNGFGGQFLNIDNESQSDYKTTDSTLQTVVLLQLASLAVISRSSLYTIGQENLLAETIQTITTFCEERRSTCPIIVSSFLVNFFVDQDDVLVKALFYSLEISTNLKWEEENAIYEMWNPHCDCYFFLQNFNFDYNVLLDLLISTETCFLLYIVKYLKFALSDVLLLVTTHMELSKAISSDKCRCSSTQRCAFSSEENTVLREKCLQKTSICIKIPNPFNRLLESGASRSSSHKSAIERHLDPSCWHSLEPVVLVFNKLFTVIERQMQKNIFPYNAGPLLNLLKTFCDKCHFLF